MRVLRSRRIGALMIAGLGAAVLATVGVAAVWSQGVLADGTNVHIRVVRTIANDFDSGWHTHPGPAIVQVEEGTFQIYQGNCTPKTITAGQTYIEIPYVPVRAVATGKITWTTTLLGRYESPLTAPMTEQPCP